MLVRIFFALGLIKSIVQFMFKSSDKSIKNATSNYSIEQRCLITFSFDDQFIPSQVCVRSRLRPRTTSTWRQKRRRRKTTRSSTLMWSRMHWDCSRRPSRRTFPYSCVKLRSCIRALKYRLTPCFSDPLQDNVRIDE